MHKTLAAWLLQSEELKISKREHPTNAVRRFRSLRKEKALR